MRHEERNGMKDIWLITNNDGLRYHALITCRNAWTTRILIAFQKQNDINIEMVTNIV
jgi:hypothetical protein